MERITLAHGSGGKKTYELIKGLFFRELGNEVLERTEDSAVVAVESGEIAFTTDSFVIKPVFFPGGDIGKLAICGTVNDLAVQGAEARYISCGFIIEEGFSLEELERIVVSMASAANEAGVKIVAGDTKVVGRGEADGLFINTSGIGVFTSESRPSAGKIRAGHKVIVTGTLGDHGLAVLSKRKGLEFDTPLESDCAPLNGMLGALVRDVPGVDFMRDPTRGGLATTLNEAVRGTALGITLEEASIPVSDAVRGGCELLGLDPLYMANEGKAVMMVDPAAGKEVLAALRSCEYGREAAVIGEVTGENPGKVCVRTKYGVARIIDMLTGEQLPRIC
ncbi:MAG: hydrogenase expression/formation protein HypE [Candidatus Omnitrophica bacterium]|nr:hydrogenase expression/formation protein HypE [Candidatus Omnitrophota bacterium]